MKTFFNEGGQWTKDIHKFSDDILKALEPILDAYNKQGYTFRDMELALLSSIIPFCIAKKILRKKSMKR